MASSIQRGNIPVYHEKEVLNRSERMIRNSEKYGDFIVICNKALGNCLLQQPYYTENINVILGPIQLETTFQVLTLSKYFNIHDIEKWLDSTKSDLLGSILALNQALLEKNIFLNPVDNMTYTTLVERPKGLICLLDKGWVVIRNVGSTWYLLDPRSYTSKRLSDTYLDLIVKQLLVNEEPVFRVSGCGFSINNIVPAVSLNLEIKGRYLTAKPNNCDNAMNTGVNSESKPPDLMPPYLIPQSVVITRERLRLVESVREISKLNIGPNVPRRQRTRDTHGRSRSECRTQQRIQVLSSPRDLDSSNQVLGLDREWPPLQHEWNLITRRRRAKSTPRYSIQKQDQQYHPPKYMNSGGLLAVNSTGKKESKMTLKKDRPSSSKRGNEDTRCCICLDAFPDHVLYPCGHQCLCGECKTSFKTTFKKCPICNKNVADIIKIFKT